MQGYADNIEKLTLENTKFRKVLYTATHSQLVLMSLKPGEEIGEEVHEEGDQFFRFERGVGEVVINGIKHSVSDGTAIIVPAGAKHNVTNQGKSDLKLYTIYTPPHHRDGVVHETRSEAETDNEHFDGTTTE